MHTWTFLLLQVLAKYFPGSFFGEDREGHPVWYDNFGNLDPRGERTEQDGLLASPDTASCPRSLPFGEGGAVSETQMLPG